MSDLKDVLKYVIGKQQASIPMLQRRFRISYSSAEKLINKMEELGYISKQDGMKPRKVLIDMNKELEFRKKLQKFSALCGSLKTIIVGDIESIKEVSPSIEIEDGMYLYGHRVFIKNNLKGIYFACKEDDLC